MSTIKLVSGNQLPQIQLTLTDDSTGLPIDLSASTTVVTVLFRAAGTTTVLSTLPCSNKNGGADGVVLFSFPGTVLNVTPGGYEGQINISFNGSIQSVYDVLKFQIRASF